MKVVYASRCYFCGGKAVKTEHEDGHPIHTCLSDECHKLFVSRRKKINREKFIDRTLSRLGLV